MGRLREVIQDLVRFHGGGCRFVSGMLLSVSLILVTYGAILTSQNTGSSQMHKEDMDSTMARYKRFAGGISLILVGICLFLCSLVSLCCAYQLKFIQRFLHLGNQPQPSMPPPQQPQSPPPPPPPYPIHDSHQPVRYSPPPSPPPPYRE